MSKQYKSGVNEDAERRTTSGANNNAGHRQTLPPWCPQFFTLRIKLHFCKQDKYKNFSANVALGNLFLKKNKNKTNQTLFWY